jgi:hypothetical protein
MNDSELLQFLLAIKNNPGWSHIEKVFQQTLEHKLNEVRVKCRLDVSNLTDKRFAEVDGYEEASKVLDCEIDKLKKRVDAVDKRPAKEGKY